jgi:hypothetical protein
MSFLKPYSKRHTTGGTDMLTFAQLQTVITNAHKRFSHIKAKYPNLKAYLVFANPPAQTEINSSPEQILTDFPDMVADCESKQHCQTLQTRYKAIKDQPGLSDEAVIIRNHIAKLTKDFTYHTTPRIELRFVNLPYETIWKLQTDDLVDRNLTPQTRASIRIILGTVADFISALP